MTASQPDFLTDLKLSLLIFGGKGGVGKTTCAAASAIHIAQTRPDSRVLLLSTDPAHSVADCIDGSKIPSNLCVIELSAEHEHRAFMDAHGPHLKTIASRGTFLDGSDIDKFVQLSIPGVDELMAFLRVARWIKEDSFEVIVVDTAPSGHTLKLLAMSELLNTWLEALESLLAKHRYMSQMFSAGRQSKADPSDNFLEEMHDQVETLAGVLCDESRCRFVPVLLAEAMSIAETTDILAHLGEMGVAAPELVFNRLIDHVAGEAFQSQRYAQDRVLAGLAKSMPSRTIWGAPLDAAEMTGARNLLRFAENLTPIASWQSAHPAQPAPAHSPFRCDGTAQLPASTDQTQLLFFAGKGGVGKTTMSCAAAMQLAARGRRCLLVSTDPAHSLGDCLRIALGDKSTTVTANLEAVEIDAQREFTELREQYQSELQDVLEAMFNSIDVSFDREAMEKLLDLAPPGLDECMALLRILDQLDSKDSAGQPLHDTIVIDTAPTGHLLRLLELPELIEGWLNCLFSLFIKYDKVFRLPKLQTRLIAISRGIKRLRATLADSSRCRVQVVTISTEMAFAECKDLVASLQAMNVSVGTVFINLALLPDTTPLGKAVFQREQGVRSKYAMHFPNADIVTVYRCGDPRGVPNLQQLGATVYSPSVITSRAA